MFHTLNVGTRRAAVIFSLTVGWSGAAAWGQMTSGPGLSSGSGVGTGAGGFSGVQRNQTGSLSGNGPGESAGGPGLRGRPISPPAGYPREAFGPSLDVTFPNDPYLVPFLTMEQPGAAYNPNAPTRITSDLIKNARLIGSPDERSLALQRIANGAIAGDQLTLAHNTLEEAMAAAAQVQTPLVRDQRLIAIVTSLTTLTDALLRDRHERMVAALAAPSDAPAPEALPKTLDDATLVRLARLEWQRAVYLASAIGNPTYRNEMLYRVAESEASGSATVANESTKALADSDRLDSATGEQPTRALPPAAGGSAARTPRSKTENGKQLADSILVNAFDDAKKIDRLIWKYRAMVRIALAAADSEQYSRGMRARPGNREWRITRRGHAASSRGAEPGSPR